MKTDVTFVRGANGKPVASQILEESLSNISGLRGKCFFGYPLIATPEGKFAIDAALVSPEKGIILFDLVEGVQIGSYKDRQDDIANKIEARLKLHRELVAGRKLGVDIHVITFAPAVTDTEQYRQDGYQISNADTLESIIAQLRLLSENKIIFNAALSAIESLSSIRKSRFKREVTREDSRGAKLKHLEDAIATLDYRQNRAVIETVNGVQRIRGLAGSGKTIVLALKAAYLHSQNPDWRIAVTFQTRALKGQFTKLINNFCIEQTGEEPDWTKIRIVNAWGSPREEDHGIYYEFCHASGAVFLDFRTACMLFGDSDLAFGGACQRALAEVDKPIALYDAILIDEAQDFSPEFLRLCHTILREPKRLVYAYDELQNLSGKSLPSPEDMFGKDEDGKPNVTLGDDQRRDVILQKCYRNSRPVLVTAHSLGFGIYRAPLPDRDTGLVQMFDHPRLWEEIGYRVKGGELTEGSRVVLHRTDATSPQFLEEHSPIEDLVKFIEFKNEIEQNEWLIQAIRTNLEQDELRHDDIIVIHPDAISARATTGPIRKRLFELGIPCHLAGVDTSADVFFKTEMQSITFTGIYRAKGNEAGMVYIINAQSCHSKGHELASLRNRLFTAITRSKAWVRVMGYGSGMAAIRQEFEDLKKHSFELDFVYPPKGLLEKLRVIHRDLSPEERKRLEQRTRGLSELVRDLESGIIRPEDIDTETRGKLRDLLLRDSE
ncbi:DEAD/DEAH box helicase [Nitrosomonas communis]|uniref:DEAD/DEAH box helicase n=1 Tax=Nitrosomonas communis TaxID=44574 RepID=UPI003D281999